MDLDELDAWFDEERERLFQKLKDDSEKDKDGAESEYKEEMKKIREKYDRQFAKCMHPKKKSLLGRFKKK